MLPRIQHVIEEEKVDMTEDGLKSILHLAFGDMRKALNILQSTYLAFGKVNEENVYNCVGHPSKNDMINVMNWMLNDNFNNAYARMNHLKLQKGYALQDLITEIHRFVQSSKLFFKVKLSSLTFYYYFS